MSKQQTAVEWLVQEINKINVSTEARIFINKLEKQANEMHEQQIIDTFDIWFKPSEFEVGPSINRSTLLTDLCNIVNIEHNVFMGRDRHQIILDKRHIVIALYKKYSGYTFKQTGKDCGGYDHTTVIHIVKKVNNYSQTDELFKAEVLYYENKLKNLN